MSWAEAEHESAGYEEGGSGAPEDPAPAALPAEWRFQQGPYDSELAWPAPVAEKRKPAGHKVVAALVVIVGVALLAGGVALADRGSSRAQTLQPDQLKDEADRAAWRSVPPTQFLPDALAEHGTAMYVRLGVAPDAGCKPLPPALLAKFTDLKCVDVLQATYADATNTVVGTVGVIVFDGTQQARTKFVENWQPSDESGHLEEMPSVYSVAGTLDGFRGAQGVAWSSDATQDGDYLAYAVTAFTDGRPRGGALPADAPPVQAAGDLAGAEQAVIATQETAAEHSREGRTP